MRINAVVLALAASVAGVLPLEAQSPLAAYPGFGANPEADEARFERETLARERMIADCMRQAGFQYTPAPPVEVTTADQARSAPEDPNERHARSLSTERRREYYMALYGVPDPNSPNADELWDPASGQGGGCTGEAMRAIPGVYAAASDLAEAYVEMRRSLPEDARVKAAEGRWAECMRARGLDYASPSDIRRQAAQAARAAAGDRGARDQARQRVQQASAAGRECGASSGLDSTVAEVGAEKEAAFVAQHRATLDRHAERLRTSPVQ